MAMKRRESIFCWAPLFACLIPCRIWIWRAAPGLILSPAAGAAASEPTVRVKAASPAAAGRRAALPRSSGECDGFLTSMVLIPRLAGEPHPAGDGREARAECSSKSSGCQASNSSEGSTACVHLRESPNRREIEIRLLVGERYATPAREVK